VARIQKCAFINLRIPSSSATQTFVPLLELKPDGRSDLITLENGGGKTTLITMLMQVIDPGFKASGRKIWKNVPDQHAPLIILAQFEDCAPQREEGWNSFVAGAIIRRRGSDEGGDEDRTTRFISFHKQNHISLEYIVSEFQRKVGDTYEMASNEDVRRRLADWDQKYRESFLLFPESSRQQDYRDKLDEYGIPYRLQEFNHRINSQEDGIAEAIKQCRREGSLIDEQIAPTVFPEFFAPDGEKLDSVAEKIAIYASSYEEIDRADATVEALEGLRGQLDDIGEMIQSHAKTLTCVTNIHSHLKDLERTTEDRIRDEQSRMDAILSERTKAKENKARRMLEVQSINLIECEGRVATAEKTLEKARCAYDKARGQYESCELTTRIWLCKLALRREELARAAFEARSHDYELVAKDDSKESHLANLLGNATFLAKRHFEGASARLDRAKADHDGLQDKRNSCEKTLRELREGRENARVQLERNKADFLTFRELTDKDLGAVSFIPTGGLTRMRDGAYHSKTISDLATSLTERANDAESIAKKASCDAERKSAEREDKVREGAKATATADSEHQVAVKLEAEAEKGASALATLKAKCRESSKELSDAFETHNLRRVLSDELAASSTSLAKARSAVREAQNRYERGRDGRLNVPEEIVNLLTDQGIPFQTLDSMDNVSSEQKSATLDANPLAANTVFIPKSDEDNLRNSFENRSLPYPVIYSTDATAILNGSNGGSLDALGLRVAATYPRDYITNRQAYVTMLGENARKAQETYQARANWQSTLQSIEGALQDAVMACKGDSDPWTWVERTKGDAADHQAVSNRLHEDAALLDSQARELASEIQALNDKAKKALSEAESLRTDSKRLHVAEEHNEQTRAAGKNIEEAQGTIETLDTEVERTERELSEIDWALDKAKEVLSISKDECRRLADAYEDRKGRSGGVYIPCDERMSLEEIDRCIIQAQSDKSDHDRELEALKAARDATYKALEDTAKMVISTIREQGFKNRQDIEESQVSQEDYYKASQSLYELKAEADGQFKFQATAAAELNSLKENLNDRKRDLDGKGIKPLPESQIEYDRESCLKIIREQDNRLLELQEAESSTNTRIAELRELKRDIQNALRRNPDMELYLLPDAETDESPESDDMGKAVGETAKALDDAILHASTARRILNARMRQVESLVPQLSSVLPDEDAAFVHNVSHALAHINNLLGFTSDEGTSLSYLNASENCISSASTRCEELSLTKQQRYDKERGILDEASQELADLAGRGIKACCDIRKRTRFQLTIPGTQEKRWVSVIALWDKTNNHALNPEQYDSQSARNWFHSLLDGIARKLDDTLKGEGQRENAKRAIKSKLKPSVIMSKAFGNDEIGVKTLMVKDRTAEMVPWGWNTGASGAQENVRNTLLVMALAHCVSPKPLKGQEGSTVPSSAFLIMDNPFGSISKEEYLRVLQEARNQLKIQVIAFSHMNEDAIFRQFEVAETITPRITGSGRNFITNDEVQVMECPFRTETTVR
jgi:hypothetical protein